MKLFSVLFVTFGFVITQNMISALCLNSLACGPFMNDAANKRCATVCHEQGNPKGGRCLRRDGCPKHTICACYPRKRSEEAIDQNAADFAPEAELESQDPSSYEEADESELVAQNEQLEKRLLAEVPADYSPAKRDEYVQKRTLCQLGVFKGISDALCMAHCRKIGKGDGYCDKKQICTCTH